MFQFNFQNPIGFLIAFVPFLLNILLVWYIIRHFPKNTLTNLFALLTLCVAFWQLDDSIGRISITGNTADLWDGLLSPAWIFLGPLCLHFSLIYSELFKGLPTRKSMLLLYGPGFIFMTLQQSHYYPHIFNFLPFWGWINFHDGNLIDTTMIYWISVLVISATMVLFYKTFSIRGDAVLYRQSLLISCGIAVPTFTGILTQVIFPTILHIKPLSVTSTFMTFFSLATVLALRKYKLFSVSELISNEGLIEHLPVIVFSITQDKRITYINTFGRTSLGLSEKEIPNLWFTELFNKNFDADEQKLEHAWQKAQHGEEVENIEIQIVSPKGKIDIIFSLNPIFNNNRVHGFLFTARDITELKKSGLLIQKKEALLAEAQQLSHIGSWEWDVASNVVSWSEELYRIYGYEPDEIAITYEIFLSNVYPDDKEFVDKCIQESISSHQPFSIFHRVIRKDKIVIVTHSRGKVTTDSHQNVIRLTGTAQDVTEIKTKEEILEHKNEELVKINSELDRFVYSVSHDLRAPLTSMLGVITISEDQTREPLMKKHLGLLKENIQKLDSFILDILNYSKNARTGLQIEEINFGVLLEGIFRHIGFISYKDSKPAISIDIKDPQPFYSDKNRLTIILSNLISNAIRYRKPEFSGSFVKIFVETSKQEAVIRICDNGIGIQKKHLPRIFEMFYRGSESSAGSGLGLYIASEAVKKLQGKIEVISEIEIGTEFILILPNNLN